MVVFFYVYLAVATLEMLLVTNIIPMTVGAYKVCVAQTRKAISTLSSRGHSPLTLCQLCLLSFLLLPTSAL